LLEDEDEDPFHWSAPHEDPFHWKNPEADDKPDVEDDQFGDLSLPPLGDWDAPQLIHRGLSAHCVCLDSQW